MDVASIVSILPTDELALGKMRIGVQPFMVFMPQLVYFIPEFPCSLEILAPAVVMFVSFHAKMIVCRNEGHFKNVFGDFMEFLYILSGLFKSPPHI